MSKLVIVTHPDLAGSKVNRAWVNELSKYQEKLKVHEIYDLYPKLEIDVQAEQELLLKYDEIIFQFPMHWFNVPFFLKQYIDQVFTFGWAFGPGGDKMKGKKIRMAVSTGGTLETYTSMVTLEELLKPMSVSFQYCGCEVLSAHRFHGAGDNPSDSIINQNAIEYLELLLES